MRRGGGGREEGLHMSRDLHVFIAYFLTCMPDLLLHTISSHGFLHGPSPIEVLTTSSRTPTPHPLALRLIRLIHLLRLIRRGTVVHSVLTTSTRTSRHARRCSKRMRGLCLALLPPCRITRQRGVCGLGVLRRRRFERMSPLACTG